MLDSLTQRLTKVVKTIRGQARLTESNMQDMLREIRIALLEADVAIPVVKDLIARIKEKATLISHQRANKRWVGLCGRISRGYHYSQGY